MFNEIEIENIVQKNQTTGGSTVNNTVENQTIESTSNSNNTDIPYTTDNMAENAEFFKTASAILKNNYSGESSELESFIAALELADTIATAAQKPVLIKLIKTKLSGHALEIFPENPNAVADIVNVFRNKVKRNNSKIVAGRMMALKVDRLKIYAGHSLPKVSQETKPWKWQQKKQWNYAG